MSLATRLSAWCIRQGDRANPMLVRRVRQELRSRTFLGVFLLLLTLATVAAAVASMAAQGRTQGAGRGLLAFTAACWGVIMCIQAFGTHRTIASERAAAAWDLIELTTLSPRRVLWGVMLANLVTGLFIGAALAPFLVMAWLLRGIDLPSIVFGLLATPLIGVALGAVSAFLAAVGQNRQARGGMGGLTGLGLIAAVFSIIGFWSQTEFTLTPWMSGLVRGEMEAVAGLVAFLNIWAAIVWAAFVLGEALLTHRALDRSSGPRLLMVAVWLNGLLWVLGLWLAMLATGGPAQRVLFDGLLAMSLGGQVWAGILGLFAITEERELTPRQQRAVTTGGRWRRAAMALLGPGSGRGTRLLLMLLVASLACGLPHIDQGPFWILSLYIVIVLVAGDLLARRVLGRWCDNPLMRRAVIIGFLAVIGIVPPILGQFTTGDTERLLMALSPFTGTAQAFDEWRHALPAMQVVVLLAAVPATALLVLRACRRDTGLRRVVASTEDGNPRS
jgi:hypothetical protein